MGNASTGSQNFHHGSVLVLMLIFQRKYICFLDVIDNQIKRQYQYKSQHHLSMTFLKSLKEAYKNQLKNQHEQKMIMKKPQC